MGSFGAADKVTVPVTIPDPAASATIVVFRAPTGQGKVTVTAGAINRGAQAGGASNGGAYQLKKIGVDGAATPVAISNNLGVAVAGSSPAWAANVPLAFNMVGDADGETDANVLAAGEYLTLTYTKTGTDAPGLATLFLEVANGVA